MLTTVAQLRRALSAYFDESVINTALRCARLAGQIGAGSAGRDGCGSAPVTVRQALLVVLALASDAHPKDAPAAAERIAGFRLLRRDENPGGGEPTKRMRFENQHIDLLTTIALEIERFDSDRVPSAWAIAAHGCCQIRPDRLVFGPSLEALTDPADSVTRNCHIPARLLGDIAELFHARAKAAA